MEFMEWHREKLAALDGRILEGQTKQQQLQEKIKVLPANARQDQPRGEGEGDRDNPVCAVYDRLVFVFVLYSSCVS